MKHLITFLLLVSAFTCSAQSKDTSTILFPAVWPKADFNNAYNFYIGMGAGAGIEKGSFNIIVKEYGLSQVTDTSFAFMVDYNSPMIKNHSMLKQYLYQVDLLFQDNPDLRKDTLFQIAIHKQLNGMFNFR